MFLIISAIFRRRATRKDEAVMRDYLEAESSANATRAVNLSELTYITVPDKILQISSDNEEAMQCRDTVRELSEKRILNLNGKTNTEIKLLYGAANLEALSEYDESFTTLCITLNTWGTKLHDAGQDEDAMDVLSYAVEIGSDISTTYLTLGDLYFSAGKFDAIDDLVRRAEGLESLSKGTILHHLRSY